MLFTNTLQTQGNEFVIIYLDFLQKFYTFGLMRQ